MPKKKKVIPFADLPYHFGLKLTAHPTKKQQDIIRINSIANNMYYNLLIDIDTELFNLKHVALNGSHRHPDYFKLKQYLIDHRHASDQMATFMVDYMIKHRNDSDAKEKAHPIITRKTIKEAKAPNYYKWLALKDLDPQSPTGYQPIDDRIHLLQAETRNAKLRKTLHPFLANYKIDSNMISNVYRAHQAAWQMYLKVPNSQIPKKHYYHNEEHYRTSTIYNATTKQKETPNLLNSSNIRFLDRHHLHLPKIGIIKVNNMRDLIWDQRKNIQIGTVTIRCNHAGKYTISLQLGSKKPFVRKKRKCKRQIGIDLNTENFSTDNYGHRIENPHYYKKALPRLKKESRKLSLQLERAKAEHRDLRTASNYQAQRRKVARLHDRIANQRDTFIHQVSSELIKQNQLIVAEELRPSNMMKNHHLAQSIQDVGWRLLLTKLDYKAPLYGRKFITINKDNTSRICSNCKQKNHEFDHLTTNEWLKVREWTCPNCHAKHIRDQNAAINILERGLEKINQN